MSGFNNGDGMEASLRRREKLFVSSPAAKLLRSPLRMAWTIGLEKWTRLRKRPRPVTANTFWGGRMALCYPDDVSIAIHRYGFFEAGLTTIVLRRIREGMTFFDIGAHFGYFTTLAASRVGPSGKVHSFEPSARTFEVLKQNAAGKPNITLNPCAVYSERATLSLTDYGWEHPAFNTVGRGNLAQDVREGLKPVVREVPAVSVDEYVAQSGARPDFVKIDAEGAERFILQGMVRTLKEIRPMITLEVGDLDPSQPPASRGLLETVIAHGYRAMEYDAAMCEIRPHTLQERYAYDNILLEPTQRGAV